MSVIIDEITGKPVVIERPLLAEHVKVGRLIWYSGYTSLGEWDCPAIITRVNKSRRLFRVRSLDDMVEQSQWYDFSHRRNSCASRQTMRLTDTTEVKAYLDKHRPHLAAVVENKKASLERAVADLNYFDKLLATLNF